VAIVLVVPRAGAAWLERGLERLECGALVGRGSHAELLSQEGVRLREVFERAGIVVHDQEAAFLPLAVDALVLDQRAVEREG